MVSDPDQHAERKRIGTAFDRLAEAICLLAEPESALGRSSSTRRAAPNGLASAPARAASLPEARYDPSRRFASYDVFLDCGSQDRETAQQLSRELAQRGLQVFLERNDLRSGEDSEAVVGEALFHSRALLVCVGARPLTDWRKRTLETAQRLQLRQQTPLIVAAMLPGSDASALEAASLHESQAIDLRGGVGEAGLEQLLVALQGKQRVSTVEASIAEPYVGMRTFEEVQSRQFFGRTRQVTELERAIENRPFVALVGPSGSGKSSLVQAALIPLLRAGKEAWLVEIMRPGVHPLEALAAAVSALTRQGQSDASPSKRAARDRRLRGALRGTRRACGATRILRTSEGAEPRARPSGVVLVVTRSDFEAELQMSGPPLEAAARVELGAMTPAELREAIEGPAESAGIASSRGSWSGSSRR